MQDSEEERKQCNNVSQFSYKNEFRYMQSEAKAQSTASNLKETAPLTDKRGALMRKKSKKKYTSPRPIVVVQSHNRYLRTN